MAEDRLNFRSCKVRGVFTQHGEAGLVLERLCAWRLPLQDLLDAAFGLWRKRPHLSGCIILGIFDRWSADLHYRITQVHD